MSDPHNAKIANETPGPGGTIRASGPWTDGWWIGLRGGGVEERKMIDHDLIARQNRQNRPLNWSIAGISIILGLVHAPLAWVLVWLVFVSVYVAWISHGQAKAALGVESLSTPIVPMLVGVLLIGIFPQLILYAVAYWVRSLWH
jgi:hypothetical protein